MRPSTPNDGTRAGRLVVVSKDLRRGGAAGYSAPTMQAALDDWERVAPGLEWLAIERAIERHSGDKKAAAEELGVSIKTLYNKINAAEERAAA